MEQTRYGHLTSSIDQDTLVVTLTTPRIRGDELAFALQLELLELVAQSGARQVILDFQHVVEISSRGFGAIAAFHQEYVKGKGGQVILCGLSPLVLESLALIRFVDGKGSMPAVEQEATGPEASRPRARPLFEAVEADIPAALARAAAGPNGA